MLSVSIPSIRDSFSQEVVAGCYSSGVLPPFLGLFTFHFWPDFTPPMTKFVRFAGALSFRQSIKHLSLPLISEAATVCSQIDLCNLQSHWNLPAGVEVARCGGILLVSLVEKCLTNTLSKPGALIIESSDFNKSVVLSQISFSISFAQQLN